MLEQILAHCGVARACADGRRFVIRSADGAQCRHAFGGGGYGAQSLQALAEFEPQAASIIFQLRLAGVPQFHLLG
jgi:hypothetical protein